MTQKNKTIPTNDFVVCNVMLCSNNVVDLLCWYVYDVTVTLFVSTNKRNVLSDVPVNSFRDMISKVE